MSRAAASLLAIAILVAPALASADPVVVVYVRRDGTPVEAEVTLRDANDRVHTCRTSGGTCRLDGVAAGRFTVSARATDDGGEMPGRPVMIPPDGKVSLIVAVP